METKRTTIKRWLGLSLVCLTLVLAHPVRAQAGGQYLVLGVIASVEPGEGVVLMKSTQGGRTFASRVGQEIDAGMTVVRVTREFVYLRIGKRVEKIAVGEQLDLNNLAQGSSSAPDVTRAQGFERHGNTVKVSASFREEVVKRQLSKVLMQAAAVPYYENGALAGFRLWDIEPNSVYDMAGLANGDTVTAINGQALTDIGHTIRLLQSLKEEARVEVTLIRKRVKQTLEIVVQ